MARTRCLGFEANDPLVECGLSALPTGVTFDATIVRTGGRSLKIVPASGSALSQVVPLTAGTPYTRVYVRITTLPSAARVLVGSNVANQACIIVNPDGSLTYQGRDGSSNIVATETSVTLLTDSNAWYRLEWVRGTDAINPGDTLMRIDGVDVTTSSTVTAGTILVGVVPGLGCSDSVAATYTAYFDDCCQDDATWPGDGAVVLSLPISDNARGGWTGGASGTTNLFDAVNNTPPIGKAAASETNLTQTKNAVSSATDNCDFNMQSYTTAGVPSGATVNAVQAVVAHGEEISTGTKAGALKIVSNPAQSVEDTFNFGSDLGAEGTYPTNWDAIVGTAQSGAGVTFGTSPVVRVGKRTATTRAVNACFVGLYIDYTPAIVTTPSTPGSFIRSQAVMRAANW